jgi:hypothetical protein
MLWCFAIEIIAQSYKNDFCDSLYCKESLSKFAAESVTWSCVGGVFCWVFSDFGVNKQSTDWANIIFCPAHIIAAHNKMSTWCCAGDLPVCDGSGPVLWAGVGSPCYMPMIVIFSPYCWPKFQWGLMSNATCAAMICAGQKMMLAQSVDRCE